jgi:aminoglycoside phosphotransferase (APT) family kinase protein
VNPVAQIHQLVRTETGRQGSLCVEYLRRKPKRGLVARYTTRKRDRSWTVFVDENSLSASDSKIGSGISIVPFPTDASLPMLADAVDATSNGPIAEMLLASFREATDDAEARISHVDVTTVRYKPNERCVLKYNITGHRRSGPEHTIEVFAKLFANTAQADRMYTLGRYLYHPDPQGLFRVPRPLVVSSQGIVISQSAAAEFEQCTGERGRPVTPRSGESVLVTETMNTNALQNTGRVLAWLHNHPVAGELINALGLDCEPDYAKRPLFKRLVQQTDSRADLLMGVHPAEAENISRVRNMITTALQSFDFPDACLVHGAFKPSQFVFVGEEPVVLDFDGARLGDPALDLGYLFAYLRAPTHWSRRNGRGKPDTSGASDRLSRQRREIMCAYLQSRGVTDPTLMHRAATVEAAILFKIATRRVNRLQAPRTHEVIAMLTDAQTCLERSTELPLLEALPLFEALPAETNPRTGGSGK